MTAVLTARISRGVGSHVWGSAPAGTSEVTCTRSPPTLAMKSAKTLLVVTTWMDFGAVRPSECASRRMESHARTSSREMSAGAAIRVGCNRFAIGHTSLTCVPLRQARVRCVSDTKYQQASLVYPTREAL